MKRAKKARLKRRDRSNQRAEEYEKAMQKEVEQKYYLYDLMNEIYLRGLEHEENAETES